MQNQPLRAERYTLLNTLELFFTNEIETFSVNLQSIVALFGRYEENFFQRWQMRKEEVKSCSANEHSLEATGGQSSGICHS